VFAFQWDVKPNPTLRSRLTYEKYARSSDGIDLGLRPVHKDVQTDTDS